MKRLLFILLLLPSLAYPQLSGKYEASAYLDDDSYNLTFSADRTFSYLHSYSIPYNYNHGSCILMLTGKAGQGHYKVINDTLMLHFEADTATIFMDGVTIDSVVGNLKTYFILNFAVNDEKGEGMIGSNISVSIDPDKPAYTTSADLDGKATLSIPDIAPGIATRLHIMITGIGYKTVKFTMNADDQLNYNVKVALHPQWGHSPISPGTTLKYLIKKVTQRHIRLLSLSDNKVYRFSLYK